MASPVQPINPAIRFFDPSDLETDTCTFAIIVSRYRDQWIWVRHKDRTTWELPAGHVEPGETPLEAARRELYEETGAMEFNIDPVVSYEGIYKGNQVFGMIYLADIFKLGPMPDFEIREIAYFKELPEYLTYPDIQPEFYSYVIKARTPASRLKDDRMRR